MRAAWLAALAGLLPALAAGPGNALAAAPEAVEVRVATHPGFGRLVLEWPAPVVLDGHQDGQRLTLRFPRPFKADLGAVKNVLGDYVVGLVPAADGRAVVLQLAPGVTASLDVDDDRVVVVDLAPRAAASARRSGPDTGVGPGSQARVALRTGVHDGYLRIVLDWAQPIDFATGTDGRRLRIRFDRAAPIDAATIRARGQALLDGASAADADGRSELRLALKPGVHADVFKVEDRQIVIDLYEPGRTPPARAAPEPVPAIAPRALPGAALPEPAAAPPEPPAAPPAPEGSPTAAEASPLAPEGSATALERPATAPDGARTAAEAAPLTLGIRAATVARAAALEFVWNRPIAATFLLRAGYLWSVFAPLPSQAGTLVLPSLASPVPDWLGPGERVDAAGGLALRFPLRRPLAAKVERAGGRWRVVLDTTAPLPAAAQLQRLPEPPRLRIVTGETPRLVRLADPEVGDQLEFWPLLASRLGQPRPQRLVGLELLATAQGLAWRAAADQLRAEAVDGAVELRAPGGLRLSPSSPAARESGPAAGVGPPSRAPSPSAPVDASAGPSASGPPEASQSEVAQAPAAPAEATRVKAAPTKHPDAKAAPPRMSTPRTSTPRMSTPWLPRARTPRARMSGRGSRGRRSHRPPRRVGQRRQASASRGRRPPLRRHPPRGPGRWTWPGSRRPPGHRSPTNACSWSRGSWRLRPPIGRWPGSSSRACSWPTGWRPRHWAPSGSWTDRTIPPSRARCASPARA